MVLLGDSRVPLNCAVLMDRVWLSTAHNTRVTDYSGATVRVCTGFRIHR